MMRARTSNRKHSSVKLHLERLEDRLAPATLIQSTFDADTEGWTFVGDGTGLTHLASGGNPGGFVQASDRGVGSVWYWAAPAKFLGNQASAYGGNLLFDLAQSAVTSQFNADDVILLGAGQRLVHDLLANPGVDWTSYTVPLEASAWRINSRTGDPASEAQLQTVLGALTALHIRGEYRDGGDTGKLDNVRLESGAQADLEVTISASPDPVLAGDLLTYTITVANHGPDDANEVTLSTAVPANTTFASFTPLAGGTSTTPAVGGGGTITSTTSSLAAGASVSFALVVQINPSADGGTIISNSAIVSGSPNDSNTANNTANAKTTVQLRPTDLGVGMIELPDPVMNGENLTYIITVKNFGPVEARAVSLSTATPAHTTFQSVTVPAGWVASTPAAGATGAITLTNVSLLAGALATFRVVVQVDPGLGDGTILSNTVNVASDNPDSNSANNSRTVTTTVDGLRTDLAVSITSDDMPEFIKQGDIVHFDILLTNTSATAVDASNVELRLLSFGGVKTQSTKPPDFDGFGSFFTKATFSAGAEARFRVEVRITAGALSSFMFRAEVDALGRDANTANDSASFTKTVYSLPNDLAVTGTVQPSLVEAGGQLTYTIIVTNNGANAVDGVVAHVATSIPEQSQARIISHEVGPVTLFPTATSSQGICIPHFISVLDSFVRDGPVDCYLGTLAGGASATIVVTVTLPTPLPDNPFFYYDGAVVVNVVNVESGVSDPVVANNVATQATSINSGGFDLARIDSFAYYVGENVANLSISVSRDRLTGHQINYSYSTEAISAVSGVDYSAVSGSGTLDGESSFSVDKLISIPILDNPHLDGNRSFRLHFSASGNVDFGNTVSAFAHTISAIVTIFDDEVTAPTATWKNDLSGLWTDPANWDGGFVPKRGDKVIIHRPGVDLAVRFSDDNISISELRSNENIVVEGGSLTVTGPAEFQNLEIQAGGTVTFAGNEPVTIRGGINNAGTLNWAGSGKLNFTGGATFNNLAGGIFEIHTAEPAGAEPVGISFQGGGSLNNLAGGFIQIDTAEPVGIAGDWNNAGRIEWVGAGSLAFTQGADLNNLAGGIFEIHTAEPAGAEPAGISFQGGGSLNNIAGGFIQIDTAGPVNGIAGDWNNAGRITWIGSGSLAFTQGANLNNLAGGIFEIHTAEPAGAEPAGISFQGGRLNNLAGGVIDVNPAEPAGIRISNLSNDGTVTIRSGALELAAGLSTGRFDVASGAALNFIGNFAWNNGTTFTGAVRVDPAEPAGSTVSVNGSVSLTNLDVGRFGVLQVAGTLTSAGTINLRGTLIGAGTIRGNVRNAGVVRPGRSPGILTIVGNYTQTPEGLLVLEIGGRVPGVQYDQLKVTGLATLAGAVEIVLVNGFTPRSADRFRALDFVHQTGSLTPTNLAFDFGPGGSLRPLRLTPGAITGFGSLRARQRDFMFSVYANAHKNGLSLRGALHYRDVGRRLTLLSTRLTLVQIESGGGRALFQGAARLNGQHGYRFTVWVEDRRWSFTGARDRFRILIEGPDGFRYDSKDYPPLAGTLDRGALQVRAR